MLKRHISIFSICLLAICFTSGSIAINLKSESNDSTVISKRLAILKDRQEKLQKQIKVEDLKRDRQLSGVSSETNEAMNDRQDSICLALRSELTDVTLEIQEMSSNKPSSQLSDLVRQVKSQKQQVDTAARPATKPRIVLPTRPDKSNNQSKKQTR